jgi:hypothetical protein
MFERRLKELNPGLRNITYDITDLYNFIDQLADMSALVYSQQVSSAAVSRPLEGARHLWVQTSGWLPAACLPPLMLALTPAVESRANPWAKRMRRRLRWK